MISIGIDPGQTGAIAAIEDGKVIALHDMPVVSKLHGKGLQVNAAELASIIMDIKAGKEAEATVEQVSAMPGQGVTSMFGFGDSFGVIRGVIGSLQIPVVFVTPQRWKKSSGISGARKVGLTKKQKAALIREEKDYSRTLAIERHPEVSDMLTRKKDNGRSDAICIAEFGQK